MKFVATAFCALAFCITTFSQNCIELSQELLLAVKNQEMAKAEKLMEELAEIDPGKIKEQINTQEEILSFWINLYNGLSQYKLHSKPMLYKSRSNFFSEELFTVAGKSMSLDDIEHGILRKGMSKYSKGYFKNLFRDDWFDPYQAQHLDWRIHFALNCGATSCPPIRIYEPESVYKQLNENTRDFLSRYVRYNKADETVYVPKVMDWYSGDFGGNEGVEDILRKNGYIPAAADVRIKYSDYDWSMDLDSFKK